MYVDVYTMEIKQATLLFIPNFFGTVIREI